MKEETIRQIIEEVDPEGKLPQATVEELVVSLKGTGEKSSEDKDEDIDDIQKLQEQILNEPDWKRRASLAARIISKGLDK